MNPIKILTNVLAELKSWLVMTRATMATYLALFVAHLRARWAAIKGWLARKKKAILWRVVLLVIAVVAIGLLVYLYRRSPMVRAMLDNLLGNAASSLRKALNSLRNWVYRRAPQPVKAIPAPVRGDEPAVVTDRQEPIPAMPGQDGPMPEEMKL